MSDEKEETQALISESFNDGNENAGSDKESRRNLAAFWFIGLCNNFGYVVMLSAAFDILTEQKRKADDGTAATSKPRNATGFHCNPTSTGVILLADVLPTLMIKLTGPMYMEKFQYHLRIGFVIISLAASLLLVALSQSVSVSILGVVIASVSSGFGEITFLSLTSYFKVSTVSAWSSGTGMAGVAGALVYAGLLEIGLSQRTTLLLMLVVPFCWTVVVFAVLKFPREIKFRAPSRKEKIISEPTDNEIICLQVHSTHLSLKSKLQLMSPLLKYMIPLFLVYLAEYTINQGLYELLYYDNSWLSQAGQYRWFQVDYQVAVLISRSSVYILRIRKILLLAAFQWIIFFILLSEVCFSFIPSIWVTLLIVFIEGLLGGAVYVNAFFRISTEIPPDFREFSMAAASLADSLGISIAGGISLPIHNALCKLKTK